MAELKPGQFMGVPCKRGHNGLRYVRTRNCVHCDNERAKAVPKDVQAARKRAYAQRNPERVKAARRAYWERNPEKWLGYTRRRRAAKLQAEGSHTDQDVLDLAVAQGFTCVYCSAPLAKGCHIDHKTPLSRGGSDYPSNLQILCGPCNLKKNARTDEEYRAILEAERG